jgi:hypothetical protein
MSLCLPVLLQAVLEDYALPLGGDHGDAHWARGNVVELVMT